MNDHVILQRVSDWLAAHACQGWLVGGAVRDRVLGVPGHDLDVAMDGDAMALARALAQATDGHFVLLDAVTNTARIVWDDQAWSVDLVRLRAPTIEDDLRLRDFTINALAMPLAQAISDWTEQDVIDPCGGVADLRAKRLRTCSPTSLSDDPLRMLRAVRIAAQFDLTLDPALTDELQAQHATLTRSAAERVRDELLKLLALPHAAHWLILLDHVGLLTTIIPELEPARGCDQPGGYHYLPVLGHLLEAVRVWEWIEARALRGQAVGAGDVPLAVQAEPQLAVKLAHADAFAAHMDEEIDGVPHRVLFKLALLMHDIAKPQTKLIKPDGGASFHDHQVIGAETAGQVVQRLRISKRGSSYIQLVVREHMRPGQLAELEAKLTRRAIYRFFNDTNDAGPDVLVHMLCDYMAMRGPWLRPERWDANVAWVNKMLDRFYSTPEEVVRPPRLIDGRELMAALRIVPGPQVGQLLEAIREAQAGGEVTTVVEAIELARRLRTEIGEQRTESEAA